MLHCIREFFTSEEIGLDFSQSISFSGKYKSAKYIFPFPSVEGDEDTVTLALDFYQFCKEVFLASKKYLKIEGSILDSILNLLALPGDRIALNKNSGESGGKGIVIFKSSDESVILEIDYEKKEIRIEKVN